jgi:hypothetical protein
MFRPPSLLAPQIVPTAAIPPQGSQGFYVRAYRALLPPHAPDMLTVRRQVIDGTGTCTLLDLSFVGYFSVTPSQPCHVSGPRHDLLVRGEIRPVTAGWLSYVAFKIRFAALKGANEVGRHINADATFRTTLSCLLRLKAYGTYHAGAAFRVGR